MEQRKLMGVREIAKALTEAGKPVSPATISRQLAQQHYRNHGTASRPLLDLAEVMEVRANLLDPEKQRAAQIARGIAPQKTDEPSDGDDLPLMRATSVEGRLGEAKLRRALAEAAEAEMDLAERERRLVPVDEVGDAGFELGAAIRETLLARRHDLAGQLLGLGEVRAIAAALEASDRAVMEALSRKAAELIDALSRPPA